MAALDFPDAPTSGQIYDKWTWNGTAWVLTAGTGSNQFWTSYANSNTLSAGTGIKDLFNSPTDTRNVNRITEVIATIGWGFNAAGSVNADGIIYRRSDSTVAVQGPGASGSGTSLWGERSLMSSWTSAPGVEAGFKVSVNIAGAPAGTNWGFVNAFYRVYPI